MGSPEAVAGWLCHAFIYFCLVGVTSSVSCWGDAEMDLIRFCSYTLGEGSLGAWREWHLCPGVQVAPPLRWVTQAGSDVLVSPVGSPDTQRPTLIQLQPARASNPDSQGGSFSSVPVALD